jgi:cation diffusion facilitator family transporter
MHTHSLDSWKHDHIFLGRDHDRHERRTWIVVALTAAMMVAEIAGGMLYGSMALLADGWHMATHAAALGIAGLAYLFARRQIGNPRFTLGTGKFGDLAAFASAVILGMIALSIAYESVVRLLNPVNIDFREAVIIAIVGLGVNIVSAVLLHHRGNGHNAHTHHTHGHHDDTHRHHDHGHADQNHRAAYIHVLADALTSVLAIAGLLASWRFGWVWADPAVGLAGAAVILSWTVSLLRSSGRVLLDALPDPQLAVRVRQLMETNGDRVADLHLWQVGPGHTAAIVSIVTHEPHSLEDYKARLAGIPTLSHVTVEVQSCSG